MKPSAIPQCFPTCLVDTFRPEVGRAVMTVLRRAVGAAHCPQGLTCCGQPAFNAGDWEAARAMARRTIRLLEAHPGPVVVPSGSCAAMLRKGYPQLFAEEAAWAERARALAARTYEFTEYLVDIVGVTDLSARFPRRVAYHPSCHLLRGLGVDRQPRALLAAVRGLELVPFADQEACCGFGGVFSAEQPLLAQAILRRKVEALQSSGAEALVGADLGCLLHLEAGLRAVGLDWPVLHVAEVLAMGATESAAMPSPP